MIIRGMKVWRNLFRVVTIPGRLDNFLPRHVRCIGLLTEHNIVPLVVVVVVIDACFSSSTSSLF